MNLNALEHTLFLSFSISGLTS